MTTMNAFLRTLASALFFFLAATALAQPTVYLTPDLVEVQTGDEFCLEFRTLDFTDLQEMRFSVRWDPEVVTLTDIPAGSLNPNVANLSIDDFTYDNDAGYLVFDWKVVETPPCPSADDVATLADGEVLFELCFGGLYGFTEVTIGNEPESIYVTRLNSCPQNIGMFTDGAIVFVDCCEFCVEFEGLTAGDPFGSINGDLPGDLLLTEDAVAVTMHPFTNSSGSTTFGGGIVADAVLTAYPPIDNNYLGLGNIALSFDFSQLPAPVNGARFGFVDAGGTVNLAVNGEAVNVAFTMLQLPLEIAPGITLTLYPEVDNDNGLVYGWAFLEGPIETLLIGGQELAIDNVCPSLADFTPPCQLSELTVVQAPCQDNDSFFVDLDLIYQNVGVSGFSVQGNGNDYGIFEYADLPVTLGPLPGDGTFYEFVVQDVDHPDCSIAIDYAVVDCDESCVQLEDLPAGTYYGTESGQSPGDLMFSENGVDIFLDEFMYSNGNTGFMNVYVDEAGFGYPSLFTANTAFMGNISMLYDFSGLADPVVSVSFAFAHGGGENNFAVNGGTVFVVNDFTELTLLTIPNVSIDVVTTPFALIAGYVTLTGNIESLLIGGQELIIDNICFVTATQPACEIFDLVVEPQPCTPNGVFFVDLDFQYQNVGSNGFSVHGNGNDYGVFGYDELPVTLGPLSGDGTTVWEFVVTDVDFPDCSNFAVIDPVDCQGDCGIHDLSAELLQVTSNGLKFLINFIPVNTQGSGFDLFFNDDYIGFFPYSDVPFDIVLPCTNSPTGTITVCDSDSQSCCSTVEVETPPCGGGDCHIFDVVVEAGPCNNDGFFFVDLDFQYQNVSGDGFTVTGGGLDWGAFGYDELPITLGPLAGDGTTVYEFVVKDVAHPDCSDFAVLGPIDCNNGACNISDLTTELLSTTADGHWVLVDFNSVNTGGLGFDLFFNGDFLGFFNYNDLPVEVLLPCIDIPEQQLTVCDNDNPNCCETVMVALPACGGDCGINDLSAELLQVTSNGLKFLIDFIPVNTQGSGFDLFFNDDYIGFFPYSDVPFDIVLPCTNSPTGTITVCDSDSQSCCSTVEVETPPCGGGDCHIFDVVVEAGPCNNDGFFFVDLDFQYQNVSGDGFTVTGGGLDWGAFGYDELPITLGPLAGDGTTVYEFVVKDVAHPDCSDFAVLGPIDCNGGDCGINDLSAELLQVTSNGLKFLIDFIPVNTQGSGFDLYFNNNYIGFFPYSDVPFDIVLPCTNSPTGTITVCDSDSQSCCSTVEVETPPCGGDPCDITVLEAEVLSSGPDGYLLWVNVEAVNTGDLGFDLFFENEFIGFFGYDEVPLEVFVPCINLMEGHIKVCDNDNSNCCATIGIALPPCGVGDCHIFDLFVEPYECNNDGTFLVDLTFQYDGVGPEGFQVVGNGNNYGTFSYADLPLTLGPLQGDGVTNYEFGVFDLNDPDCGDSYLLGPVDCDGCGIGGLTMEILEITANGYIVWIDLEQYDPDNLGFDLFLGDDLIGFFSYNDLPIELELPCFPDNFIVLTACANDQPDCCTSLEVELPPCSDGCQIFGLTATPTECNNDQQFFVELDFDFVNVGNMGFSVIGNGNDYGDFEYADLPILLGPFTADGTTVLEFIVKDNAHPDCSNFIELGPVNCGEDCVIGQIFAQFVEITGDGVKFEVEFGHENTGSGFAVFVDGELYETFSYDHNPFFLVLPCSNTGYVAFLTICDQDHPDCCNGIDLEVPPCGDACDIFDLVVEVGDCHDDGTYTLFLNFGYSNPGNDFFEVFYQGELIDFFPLNELPLVIEHFPGVNSGIDEITVCINDQPNCCETVEFEAPNCEQGDVWPGDANSDNIADNFDLLNVGIGFGTEGPSRSNVSIGWQAWPADNWPQMFNENDVNYKHADCNGNGLINTADLGAILENYGLTHGPVAPYVPPPATDNDPPLFVNLPNGTDIIVGEPFTAPIVLGTENLPVDDIYGLAFTLEFDPEVIDPNSIDVQFAPSWLGVDQINMITLSREFANEGRIDVALSRTDQNNVSGFGPIAAFIGIIDDVLGKVEVKISVTRCKAIMFDETQIPLQKPMESVIVTDTHEPAIASQIRLYPNPTNDWLFFSLPVDLQIDELKVIDVDGRVLRTMVQPGHAISLRGLPSAVYWLQLRIDGQIVHKKVVKF